MILFALSELYSTLYTTRPLTDVVAFEGVLSSNKSPNSSKLVCVCIHIYSAFGFHMIRLAIHNISYIVHVFIVILYIYILTHFILNICEGFSYVIIITFYSFIIWVYNTYIKYFSTWFASTNPLMDFQYLIIII